MLEDYSKYSELNRVPVIDVPITGTNMADCINFLAEHIDELHGEYICVSNAHTSVLAHDDPSYWDCQAESVMSVPDGKPLSVVGRKSFESMDRVTGPDLMREIFEISSQYGWSHYFYGNEQKNLDALRESLNRDFPGLKIVGMEPSVFRPLSDNEKYELSNRIANSGANFAWIALGAPRQEVLMHELKGGATAVDDRCWRSVQCPRWRGARGADMDAKPESRVAIQTNSRAKTAFQTIPRNQYEIPLLPVYKSQT